MIKEIRYTEIFYSLQGEGRFVGVPSLFFRTFGCNFRCKSFGLPRGSVEGRYNPEVKKLIDEGLHETATKFEDLPLVHTGCDTYASIYPEFKHFNRTDPIDKIPNLMLDKVPNKLWKQKNGQDIHLIFTGGEPLLGWQDRYSELLAQPNMQSLQNITFETNTTQLVRDNLYNYLESQQDRLDITFSCSPKLSVSGESWDDAIQPEKLKQYASLPNSNVYLKFVVADRKDVEEVQDAVSEYRKSLNYDIPVYLMPLGGRSEGYTLTVQEVAGLAMEQGWRFTPRLHIDLFGNAWGT